MVPSDERENLLMFIDDGKGTAIAQVMPRDGEHVHSSADEDCGDGGEGEAEVPRVLANERTHAEKSEYNGFGDFAQQA